MFCFLQPGAPSSRMPLAGNGAAARAIPADVAVGVFDWSGTRRGGEPGAPIQNRGLVFRGRHSTNPVAPETDCRCRVFVDGVTNAVRSLGRKRACAVRACRATCTRLSLLSATIVVAGDVRNGFLLYARDLSLGLPRESADHRSIAERFAARLVARASRSFCTSSSTGNRRVAGAAMRRYAGDPVADATAHPPLNMESKLSTRSKGSTWRSPIRCGHFTEQVAALRSLRDCRRADDGQPSRQTHRPNDQSRGQRVFVGGAGSRESHCRVLIWSCRC